MLLGITLFIVAGIWLISVPLILMTSVLLGDSEEERKITKGYIFMIAYASVMFVILATVADYLLQIPEIP